MGANLLTISWKENGKAKPRTPASYSQPSRPSQRKVTEPWAPKSLVSHPRTGACWALLLPPQGPFSMCARARPAVTAHP